MKRNLSSACKWRLYVNWYGSDMTVFGVGVVPSAPGSSTLLARPLANPSMKRCGTLNCSATRSLRCMFAPITRAKSQGTKRDVKQDWERLYRAAILEPDRSKLLQRVKLRARAGE